MGATSSKDELLYQEVQNGNHDAVKSLHRDGASLEWIDKDGRTPLLLACSRAELLDMAISLLNLGANMKAYCPGSHGGYPLHYAAKRGLDKTVTLLLSRGANLLSVNDEGHTPLDMARSRGHVAVVRLLEEKLCIFSGTVRELSGFGILESLAPNLVTKKVWAVVLPLKSHSRVAPEYELAIYEPPKLSLWNGVRASSGHPAGLCNVSQPRSVITLMKVEMEEPDFTLADPVLCITDKVHRTKYKFFSEKKGDIDQLRIFYTACREGFQGSSGNEFANGYVRSLKEDYPEDCEDESLSQTQATSLGPSECKFFSQSQPVLQSISAPSSETFPHVTEDKCIGESVAEDLAFALALNESIRTATAEGVLVSPEEYCSSGQEPSLQDMTGNGKRHHVPNKRLNRTRTTAYRAMSSASQKWASTRFLSKSLREVFDSDLPNATPTAPPSAPPLPHRATCETHSKSTGVCVVCWDAPAEGACIPCGHLAGCMNCLAIVKSKSWGCPVCRGMIEQVIKVYAV